MYNITQCFVLLGSEKLTQLEIISVLISGNVVAACSCKTTVVGLLHHLNKKMFLVHTGQDLLVRIFIDKKGGSFIIHYYTNMYGGNRILGLKHQVKPD